MSNSSCMRLFISSIFTSLSVFRDFRYSLCRFLLKSFYHSTIYELFCTNRVAKSFRYFYSFSSGSVFFSSLKLYSIRDRNSLSPTPEMSWFLLR